MTATPTRRAPGASRTHTTTFRRRVLCPVKLQRHFVGHRGLEPRRVRLKVGRSPIELVAPAWYSQGLFPHHDRFPFCPFPGRPDRA